MQSNFSRPDVGGGVLEQFWSENLHFVVIFFFTFNNFIL